MCGECAYRILVIYKRKQTSNIYHNFWFSQVIIVLNDDFWSSANSMQTDGRKAVMAGQVSHGKEKWQRLG